MSDAAHSAVGAVSVEDLRAEALGMLEDVIEGDPLDPRLAALVAVGVCASVTALDTEGTRTFTIRALDAGASAAQVHETLVLVSGLGVHTLMEGSPQVAAVLRERGGCAFEGELDERQQVLWDRHVGSDPYWDDVEREVPGFLDALLRLSPEAFEAFFAYCAVPWRTGALRAMEKELISLAVDATPSHRWAPGMRLHLMGAVRCGAGRAAVLQALDIAAAAPVHNGRN